MIKRNDTVSNGHTLFKIRNINFEMKDLDFNSIVSRSISA